MNIQRLLLRLPEPLPHTGLAGVRRISSPDCFRLVKIKLDENLPALTPRAEAGIGEGGFGSYGLEVSSQLRCRLVECFQRIRCEPF